MKLFSACLFAAAPAAASYSAVVCAEATPAEPAPVPVVAADYFSEDGAKQRSRSTEQGIDNVDIYKGGLKLAIPLFSISGAGGPLEAYLLHPGR
ncbi:hypothetical protein [Chitinolyticbacter albus]|uniref:hypothetical protein n=1 Tax=Chitinolyticbacter albus TaxID=2961951 RepID=UPI002108D89E|nr:hypothetical protein [Chitinolyticbacter albus]